MSQSILKTKAVTPNSTIVAKEWVRNPEWVPMPSFTPGEQKYAMLYKVHDGPNPVGFRVTGAAYTVDWGDGSAPENVAVNTTASHDLSWAGCDPDTLTSDGYRQALIIVTPTSGGTFAGAGFWQYPHPAVPASTISHSGMLDFECSSPGATAPQIGTSTSLAVRHPFLEHVKFHSAMTSGYWGYLFCQCRSLQSVEGLELSQPTSTIGLFVNCVALEWAPAMDTSLSTSHASMFAACSLLAYVPVYDYSQTTNTAAMFVSCGRLVSVGAFNTSAALTDISAMFYACGSLRSVGAFTNTASVTTTVSMYLNCFSLVDAPDLNLPMVTTVVTMYSGCQSLINAPAMTFGSVLLNMTSCFFDCVSIRTLPVYNTSSVVNFTSTLANCRSLVTAPAWDLSAATVISSMFTQCVSLVTIPAYDFTHVTSLDQAFQNCTSLRSFVSTTTGANVTLSTAFTNCTALEEVSMPCGAVTNTAGGFSGCVSLRSVILTGLCYTVAVNGNQLLAAALDALYTSLGTAVGVQTVTVTTNPGTTADTPTIATSKGWTVTGS